MRFSLVTLLVIVACGVQPFGAALVWADSLRLLETKPETMTQQGAHESGKILEAPAVQVEIPVVVEPTQQEIIASPANDDVRPDNADIITQMPVMVAPESETKDAVTPRESEKVVLPENESLPSELNVNDERKKLSQDNEKTPLGGRQQMQEIVPVIVQPQIQHPARTIEDILADPMKNKMDAEKCDSLNLPSDASPMEFLEGKWRCETDLINMETNDPIVMDFVFDKKGKGLVSLKEKSGRIFSGSAKASLQNNILVMDVSRLKTTNSQATYNGSHVQCQQKGKAAVCKGKNVGKPPLEWDNATFYRVK